MFDQKVNIANSGNYSVVMLLCWLWQGRWGFCWVVFYLWYAELFTLLSSGNILMVHNYDEGRTFFCEDMLLTKYYTWWYMWFWVVIQMSPMKLITHFQILNSSHRYSKSLSLNSPIVGLRNGGCQVCQMAFISYLCCFLCILHGSSQWACFECTACASNCWLFTAGMLLCMQCDNMVCWCDNAVWYNYWQEPFRTKYTMCNIVLMHILVHCCVLS